ARARATCARVAEAFPEAPREKANINATCAFAPIVAKSQPAHSEAVRSLDVGPHAQQIVIGAGQGDDRAVVLADLGRELLNGNVHLEQQTPASIVAHHALYP